MKKMHLFVGQNEHRTNHISESLLVDCTDLAHFVTSSIEKIIAEDRCEETTSRDLINKDQGRDTDQCEPHLRLPGVLSFATKN